MSFQNLGKVETADFYIDVAFRRGKQKADLIKQKLQKADRVKKTNKPRIQIFVSVERERFRAVNRTLTSNLSSILTSFPSIDALPRFYLELVKCTIDYGQLKKSLGALDWAVKRLNSLLGVYNTKLKGIRQFGTLKEIRREFYGRASSVLKQINPNLAFLEESRRIIRNFPSLRTEIPTVAIAGYPNVGKTTLLKALTKAQPKIAPYPFTTQRLMLGYAVIGERKFQFIDTPGLLDRPFDKRNRIEIQAILALRHLANMILFVVDASESCGYSVEDQLKLLKEIKSGFKIPLIVLSNKSDLAETEIENAIRISAEKGEGIDKVIETISTL